MTLVLITLGILTASLLFGFLYSYILMYTDWFKNMKIRVFQLEKPLSRKEFFARTPLIIGNIAALYLLSAVGLYFGQGLFTMEFPTIGVFILQFLVILVVDDLMFYIVHRTMHENKYLNQKIHSIHHQATQPFPLDFIYAHPIEWLSGYAGALVGVLLICIFGPVNAFPFWVWAAFRSLHELDIHSGVRSKISKYIPLMAGAEHHDYHHLRSKGNYASTLVLWDWVLGTWLKPKKAKKT